MIRKLNNNDTLVSSEMKNVFHLSYTVEAELLKATDFPPLKRNLESYINCENDFFGYIINEELAGVIEIRHLPEFIHIQSLVVNPKYFRQGVGKALMQFSLAEFVTDLFVVETGVDNIPAISLYKKLGFFEVGQWDTNHGIRKTKLEKVI